MTFEVRHWTDPELIQYLHSQTGMPQTTEDPPKHTHTPFNLSLTFTLYSWIKDHYKLSASASPLPPGTEEMIFISSCPACGLWCASGCKKNTKHLQYDTWPANLSNSSNSSMSANSSKMAFAFLLFFMAWVFMAYSKAVYVPSWLTDWFIVS